MPSVTHPGLSGKAYSIAFVMLLGVTKSPTTATACLQRKTDHQCHDRSSSEHYAGAPTLGRLPLYQLSYSRSAARRITDRRPWSVWTAGRLGRSALGATALPGQALAGHDGPGSGRAV